MCPCRKKVEKHWDSRLIGNGGETGSDAQRHLVGLGNGTSDPLQATQSLCGMRLEQWTGNCLAPVMVQLFSTKKGGFKLCLSQVYISCSVMLCEAGNPNARCYKGCINSTQSGAGRRKREAVIQTARHYISQGPLRLRRSSEITGDSETFLKSVMN